ncbi:hypothetical protein CC79DRAFT_502728 [Sarocladium strictum]
MASIGPQLPPSPSKRKRDDDDESPLPKQARPNTDEIDLSSDDVDFGPSAPTVPALKAPTAGPTLPNNTDEIDVGSDSDDSDTGPAPPPSIGAAQSKPAQASAKPEDSDSDSDDYGPALPSSKPQIGPALPPSAADASSGPQLPQRDDWMLAPPTSSTGYAERDPSKLKARKFASKPGAGGSKADAEISSIWTETPEEKLKRLQDSVLGRTSNTGPQQSAAQAAAEKKSKEDAERDRRIAENIEKSKKGKSLVEEHQERRRQKGHKVEDEDDDPSKRAFDKEKDMAIGGRMGGRERREMMTQAKGFSGKFSKGSYL